MDFHKTIQKFLFEIEFDLIKSLENASRFRSPDYIQERIQDEWVFTAHIGGPNMAVNLGFKDLRIPAECEYVYYATYPATGRTPVGATRQYTVFIEPETVTHVNKTILMYYGDVREWRVIDRHWRRYVDRVLEQVERNDQYLYLKEKRSNILN